MTSARFAPCKRVKNIDMNKSINILNVINTMRGKNIYGTTLAHIIAETDMTKLENLTPTLTRYMTGSTNSGDALLWHIDHTGQVQKGYTATVEATDGTLYGKHTGSITAMLQKAGRLDALYEPRPTLFGQHLIYGNKKPVHIFTDELTAIYMATMDSTAVYLAGTADDIPDNCASFMRNRSVTLHGFEADTAKKFEGMKVRMCEPLTIEVKPWKETLMEKWEKNEKALDELATKVEPIRTYLMEAAHRHYLETNENYATLVRNLNLNIVG